LESVKTVLLIGAGVPRATRGAVAQRHCPPLDADFFEIAQAANGRQATAVTECLKPLVGDNVTPLTQSLETAATYLFIKAMDSPLRSIYHRGFLFLLSLLNSVLRATTNPIPVGPRTLLYRFLLSELRRLARPEDLTIITFNYDLLLERVLESISVHGHPGAFYFPGCYRMDNVKSTYPVAKHPKFKTEEYEHKGVSVLKLHGSMNWQSTHTSNSPTSRALTNPKRELHVLNTTMLPAELSWRRDKRMVHMKPIVIPPISGKRGIMHHAVLALWTKAGQALRVANRVVIAGYSCPPLDLEARILLGESMCANRDTRIYVIDINPANGSKFLELCGVDHITIYNSIANWVRDALV
jgi:hypothetical protein